MSTHTAAHPEVRRWDTPARRLQRLVGKAPGGGYYPGGPYPITAIFGAGVVLLVLTLTKDLIWSTGDWLTDSVLIPGVSALVVLFVRWPHDYARLRNVLWRCHFTQLRPLPRSCTS